MSKIIIFGNGGHAGVVKNLLYNFCHIPIEEIFNLINEKAFDYIKISEHNLYHGIGNNFIRKRLQEYYNELCMWPILYGPDIINFSKNIGSGSQILCKVILMNNVIIGKGCIINTGAQIDHDCIIGDYCHIAPGSILCGNVSIGDNTLIGAGTIVYPKIKIGHDCIIATNKPIYKNIPDNTTMKVET